MRERGVSTVVSYALLLVVVGVLVSSLLFAMSGHVDSQNDRVVRSEMAVVGNQLAADLTTVDQMANTVGANGTVELESDLNERVGGETYLITIERVSSNRSELTLTTDEPDVSVSVYVKTDHTVEEGRHHGGDLTVVTNGTTLGVKDA